MKTAMAEKYCVHHFDQSVFLGISKDFFQVYFWYKVPRTMYQELGM
jgi:hypothetical protein